MGLINCGIQVRNRTKIISGCILFFVLATLAGCMKYVPAGGEEFDTGLDGMSVTGLGLIIANEGNFMYGNASLSWYDPVSRKVENEVFARANGMNLGDVAQSMTLRDGTVWIVVNNSGVIYAVDPASFREKGRITGFTSPRCIHFLNDDKAYVTQLWDSRIFIVNPRTRSVTGHIEIGSSSTEQMVQYDKYVFAACWSNGNRILVIDTETDEVCNEIEVGRQPSSMVIDKYDKIWVMTDGGYAGDETPALWRIDARTQSVEKRFALEEGGIASDLQLDGGGETLYYIDKSVWRMPVTAESIPAEPFLEYNGTIYYSLTIDPAGGEVYVADAIDYVQPGRIYRFSVSGELLDTFTVGITPGSFCWL